MSRRLGALYVTCVLAAAAPLGCDALVGGQCAPGHVPVEGTCQPSAFLGEGGHRDAASTGGGDGGADGTGASGPTSGSGGDGASGSGGRGIDPPCTPPEVACGSACVDLDSDPFHCGTCFNACPTGLCVDGACEGGPTGHVVIIGMDYQASTPASRRLLGNAVFMPLHNPARVLAYTEYAEPQTVAAVNATLHQQADLRGRNVSVTATADPNVVTNTLGLQSYDVLLIHDQALAAPSGMNALGLTMNGALQSYADAGGTIVVLATSAPPMAAFLSGSGLFPATGLVDVTGTTLQNLVPFDALGLGVPSPLLATPTTAGIITPEAPSPSLSFVLVADAPGIPPVAIHRVIPSE